MNHPTQEERQALVDTKGITLDDDPATISGTRLDFAHIRASGGRNVEFAWSTVARIVANGGKFRS
jgi:hypothetical protein